MGMDPDGTVYKTETNSYFVPKNNDQLPSTANPCETVEGYAWINAYPRVEPPNPNADFTGKWLVWMTCPYVEESWSRIRAATEEGALGVSAKISTDWGIENSPWREHVVCVYTPDWRDEVDALRVARSLRDIGAVKKMTLSYKPDIFTFAGRYSGNSAGDLAIYTCKAPYEEITVKQRSRDLALALAKRTRR